MLIRFSVFAILAYSFLSPTSIMAAEPGDFNSDGQLDVIDIDLLTVALGSDQLEFDLNSDSVVDLNDRDIWVTDLKNVGTAIQTLMASSTHLILSKFSKLADTKRILRLVGAKVIGTAIVDLTPQILSWHFKTAGSS